jgi:hypothetical protein
LHLVTVLLRDVGFHCLLVAEQQVQPAAASGRGTEFKAFESGSPVQYIDCPASDAAIPRSAVHLNSSLTFTMAPVHDNCVQVYQL